MNLVIDIGNTLTKVAIFDKNEITEKKVFNDSQSDQLLYYVKNNLSADGIIISAVTDIKPALNKLFRNNTNFIELDEFTPVPVTNQYNTPATLGKDRLAAVVGGKLYYTDKNLLVISAGTCITYDFISVDNIYHGGAISPGLLMRFKALHIFTSGLPLLDMNEHFDKLIGQTTEESIQSGVLNGVVAEIECIVSKYKAQFPDFKAILSGGDFKFLGNRLNNRIFAVPDLVLTGLNKILEYNVRK
jgi:type III pantothenate kinase